MTEGNTGMNALIGGVVAILTTPIFPISPIAGGAVAGYLQGGELRDGAVVGGVAGAISLLPLLLGIVFVGSVVTLAPTFGVPGGIAALGFVVIAFALAFLTACTIGFAALGGLLGVYLKTETDLGS